MVVVVLGHVAAGLVQHGAERAQASHAREVHDVLQLAGVLQGLDDQPCGCEVGLQDGSGVSLDLGLEGQDRVRGFMMPQRVWLWTWSNESVQQKEKVCVCFVFLFLS